MKKLGDRACRVMLECVVRPWLDVMLLELVDYAIGKERKGRAKNNMTIRDLGYVQLELLHTKSELIPRYIRCTILESYAQWKGPQEIDRVFIEGREGPGGACAS